MKSHYLNDKRRNVRLRGGGMRVAFHFIAIDHVQLAAPRGSEQTAKKFYAEILGFTEV